MHPVLPILIIFCRAIWMHVQILKCLWFFCRLPCSVYTLTRNCPSPLRTRPPCSAYSVHRILRKLSLLSPKNKRISEIDAWIRYVFQKKNQKGRKKSSHLFIKNVYNSDCKNWLRMLCRRSTWNQRDTWYYGKIIPILGHTFQPLSQDW